MSRLTSSGGTSRRSGCCIRRFMKKFSTRQLALNGVIAALYAAVTLLTASFAFGQVQFRIADALCVLVCFDPALTVGLTLGCLIANLFSTVSALDIVIGTAGTLLGCLLTVRIRRPWLVPVPTILSNACLVGAMVGFECSRTNGYTCKAKLFELSDVANFEKKFPREWITPDGNHVTKDFVDYALPLIQGETKMVKENGLPRFCELKRVFAK